jgi:hypothetical protein
MIRKDVCAVKQSTIFNFILKVSVLIVTRHANYKPTLVLDYSNNPRKKREKISKKEKKKKRDANENICQLYSGLLGSFMVEE